MDDNFCWTLQEATKRLLRDQPHSQRRALKSEFRVKVNLGKPTLQPLLYVLGGMFSGLLLLVLGQILVQHVMLGHFSGYA